jgi:hypothetical protein
MKQITDKLLSLSGIFHFQHFISLFIIKIIVIIVVKIEGV